MKHLPRTQENVNVNHRDRLRNLERSRPQDRPGTGEEVIFSKEGAITARTTGIKRLRFGGQVTEVWFESTDVGTGSSVFRLIYDGGVIGSSVTVTAAETEKTAYIGEYRLAAKHGLQIEVTTAGGHPDPVIGVVMKQ